MPNDATIEAEIPPSTVAIVLAAGAGSRFIGNVHKLLAPISEHSTVIGSSLTNALAAGFIHVIVVSGAIELPKTLVEDPRVRVVHNPLWRHGQAESLRVGLREAEELGAQVVVIGLGDQPFIDPRAWRLVALTDSPIAVAMYNGSQGHPVRLAREVWDVLPNDGDRGARDVIRAHPELVSQVDCPGSATDIDTEEDLAQWT